MAGIAQQLVLRREYAHSVVEACQRFAGCVLILHPGSFVCAVRRLVDEAPEPNSAAEAVFRWNSLKEGLMRGALCRHAWFHRALDAAPCHFTPAVMTPPGSFAVASTTPVLIDWAETVERSFEREHSWPPAIRAAQLLQTEPSRDWYIAELAQAVNVSAATLERAFVRTYGTTANQFCLLVRVRRAAVAVRSDAACIQSHLLGLDCRSSKDVYLPLRRLTGMTLGEVRQLGDDAFDELMSGALALPLPGFVPVVAKRRTQSPRRT